MTIPRTLMFLIIPLALFVVWLVPAMTAASEPLAASVTTIFVVRHAQKADEHDHSAESVLSDQGRACAARLADVLRSARIAAAFATPTSRARETASHVAQRSGVAVTDYNPRDPAGLAERVLRDHTGAAVLIVGHSNTVPDIVRAFGGEAATELGLDEYDNLFILTIRSSNGDSHVTTLRLHLPIVS